MINNPEFQALRREYIEGAVARSAIIREAAEKLLKGAEVDLVALRQEIHKLRGSGGFYGFQALTQAAAAAEDQLILTIDGEIDRDDQRLGELVSRVPDAAEAGAKEVGL